MFGPSISAVQRELLPALDAASLPADQEAQARSALGRLLMQFGDWDAGLVQLEQAVDALPDPGVARAASLLWLAWPYGSPRPASWHRTQAHRARAAVPAVMSPADRLMLDRLYVTRLLFLGDPEGWQNVDRIPETADRQDVALQAVLAHADLAYAAVLWGRYQDAEHHVRVTESLTSRWYFEGFTDALESTMVDLDWCLGRWEALAERATALTTIGHDRFARMESLLVGTRLAAACGLAHRPGTDPELLLAEMLPHEAPELLAQAAAEAARRRLRGGDVAASVQVTDAPTREVFASRNWLSAVEVTPARVEALVAAGRPAEAEVLLTEFEALLPHPVPERAAAAAVLCHGLLLEPHDPVQAVDHFAAAADHLAALPRPYDAALARVRRAECLYRAGARSPAVVELKTARAALVELCAWSEVSVVEGRLKQLGVRGTGWSGRRAYGDELSPRERDVVGLVAQGRTNRQISTELVLSVKTVANHVASARRKLDAPSRTALAVRAVAAGLIDHPSEQPPARPSSRPSSRPSKS